MTSYKDLSIKTKLSLIALLTCGTALTLASGALFIYEVQSFKRTLVNDLTAHATVLGGLSTAALTFDDAASANEMLGQMKSLRHIKWGIIFKKDKVFAEYQNPLVHVVPPRTAPETFGEKFTSDGLLLHSNILLNGELIGTILFCADTSQLRSRLWEYAEILIAVFLASALVALLMASRLQLAIVGPVSRLSVTARAIAEHQDYSVRVEQNGQDELGRLTGAFNQMLSRIEAQDSELREGRERFEIAVAGARDGIWDWNLVTKEMYLSPQSRAMLGCRADEHVNHQEFWLGLYHQEDRETATLALKEYLTDRRSSFEVEGRMLHRDGEYRWILTRGAALRDAAGKPYRMAGSITDITERKQAAEQITRMQRELVDASRQAGMAEVATSVLHNVGNVLNSVNVSATVVCERLAASRVPLLRKSVTLLQQHLGDLPSFLTSDPKGRSLPGFLEKLAAQLEKENSGLRQEMEGVAHNVEHIKQIVSTQQSYGRVFGVSETLNPREVIEDALRLNTESLERHNVAIQREFGSERPVTADRHKMLQILVNLLRNAKQSIMEANSTERRITIRLAEPGPDKLTIAVADTGMGISAENLEKIFRHGFTTNKNGHGFGLHASVLSAREMDGDLTVHSDGPGRGATFTLELSTHLKP